MKKFALNLLLTVAIVGLAFVCYRSIMDPIEFEEVREERQKQIIARLIDIKNAQLEYRKANKGAYTDNFDTLIHFVKTAQMPVIFKVGELNDDQLERKFTESAVLEAIEKAQKTNKWTQKVTITVTDADNKKKKETLEIDLEKEGLKEFRRDTTWTSVLDSVFGKNYAIDSIRFVPFGNGEQFTMETSVDSSKAGTPEWLFEACTPFEVYLSGINDQEMKNLIIKEKKLNRYCGLKVGDVEKNNGNAGNWE